jgi:uncharacterized protein
MTESERAELEAFSEQHMCVEPGHDFEHIKRVRNWALRIAREEGYGDLDAVEAAALLHDIGLASAVPRRKHGEIGAEMAEAYLRGKGWFSKETIVEVCHAIEFHCRNRGGDGKLLDLLRDADMMDMFGAIGLVRGIQFVADKPDYDPGQVKGETWGMTAKDFDQRFDNGTGVGQCLVDYVNFHISCYDNLATESAKRLAKPGIKFLRQFVLQLESDVLEGEPQ